MSQYYYSLLGIVRVTKHKKEWIVEVSYKDETIYIGQYKEEHKWHFIGKYYSIEELNEIVQTVCSEETKRYDKEI